MTNWSPARWLVFLGAAGMILGAALPWLSFDVGSTRLGAMGITLEGALIMAAGVALIVIALTAVERPGDVFSMPAIAVVGLAGLVGLMAFGRVSMETELTRVYFYWGLPLALASTLVAGIGSCWPVQRPPVKPARSSTTSHGTHAPGAPPPLTGTAPAWSSVLEHDVVRFCQVMWPQPDAARWKYGSRRYAVTVDYLLRRGMLMRGAGGYAWRFRQSQVMRWVGTAGIPE